MLLRTGKHLKRAPGGGHDDDGLPLSDEMLLVIFAGFLDTDDLVSCAATCRRWRRLESSEASFICRSDPGRFVPVGFFHQEEECGEYAVPRFVPLAASHYPRASANALLAGDPFMSSRLVTSRKGRLVLDLNLCRASLRLAVCNPMTGDVTVLPALSGRDKPGCYACALLTADELAHAAATSSASSLRIIIVYNSRDSLACRTYSSDTGTWGPEGKVLGGARVSGNRLARIRAPATVVRGAVFWRVKDAVLGLRVDTLEATLEPLPGDWAGCDYRTGVETRACLLAVWTDGRLCQVDVLEAWPRGSHDVTVAVLFREHSGSGDDIATSGEKWDVDTSRRTTLRLEAPAPSGYGYRGLKKVSLLGLCEKSGVVFLAAGFQDAPHREALYAVDLEKMEARLLKGVPADVGGWCRPGSCAGFHGYEIDRVAYMTSLGKRDGKGNFKMSVEDVYDF